MPDYNNELMNLLRKEFSPPIEESHDNKLISAMKLALESTVPGRAGYPNENRRPQDVLPPEMI